MSRINIHLITTLARQARRVTGSFINMHLVLAADGHTPAQIIDAAQEMYQSAAKEIKPRALKHPEPFWKLWSRIHAMFDLVQRQPSQVLLSELRRAITNAHLKMSM